ncbi:unnamed protein product [Protopolystoma xenopodis]|uniref:Uncharacterized protein n=1 Tax=Protopolystoma xenopodis TaxID=117903 RepID=A0A3S5CHD8_9PLAT|nr:unnamed protein product [Protopolystoma xenopodis]
MILKKGSQIRYQNYFKEHRYILLANCIYFKPERLPHPGYHGNDYLFTVTVDSNLWLSGCQTDECNREAHPRFGGTPLDPGELILMREHGMTRGVFARRGTHFLSVAPFADRPLVNTSHALGTTTKMAILLTVPVSIVVPVRLRSHKPSRVNRRTPISSTKNCGLSRFCDEPISYETKMTVGTPSKIL